jgi:hypothetical protein
MDVPEIIRIINAHRQQYACSCSPSLVEMLLTLAGAVPLDYYGEQDRDRNDNVGLANIRDKTLFGKTFRRFNSAEEEMMLIDRIRSELAAGKFLGIYLCVDNTFHGWVIAAIWQEQHLLLLSKDSERGGGEGCRTIGLWYPVADIRFIEHRDCIYYE